MALLNDRTGYGALTKLLHWLIVALFAHQYVGALMMLRTGKGQTTLGLDQTQLFNWHKSLGLVALAVAIARLLNRRLGELPPWAPTLSPLEHTIIHRTEQLLYAAMLVMPVSGYLYSTAGGFGVMLFGAYPLPNPIGLWPGLATAARWVHVAGAFLLLLALGTHLGLVLGHHFGLRDRLIDRMLWRRRG